MKITFFRRKGWGKATLSLLQEYSETDLRITTNSRENTDIVVFWGNRRPYRTPHSYEINSPINTYNVSHKDVFRKRCKYSPVTFFPGDIIPQEAYPLIARPGIHYGGKNLWIIKSPEDFSVFPLWKYATSIWEKVREDRYFILSGRVVWAATKIPPKENVIAWNFHQGAIFQNLRWSQWNIPAIVSAIQTMKELNIDFGGVDVIYTKEDFALLEINTAVGITGEYRPKCTAKAFDFLFKQIEKNNSPLTLTLPVSPTNWKDVIHPAIYTKTEKE